MPDTIQGFPYFPLAFDKYQQAVDPNTEAELIAFAQTDPRPLDLLVISHGWNNDMKKARDLYDRFFSEVHQAIQTKTPPGLEDRRFAVAGMYWPSMKFTDAEQIPGGVAGAAAQGVDSLIDDAIEIATPAQARQLRALAEALKEDTESSQAEVAKRLRTLLSDDEDAQGEPAADPLILKDLSDAELLRRLSDEKQTRRRLSDESGGAAGIGDFLGKIGNSVRNGLGLWTYWTMKDRAGKTGAISLAPALDRIAKVPGIRIHLIGHSFGARLVTAAAMAGSFKPCSMTLLQAAFSHRGFSPDGFFRKVITDQKVHGPILITFSSRDRAVGLSYPIASRLNGDSTSGLGDANDKFGGLGRNGAQNTVEATTLPLHGPEKAYDWTTGSSVFNLDSNQVIMDHSDIAKPQIAYALLSSISS